MAGLKRILLAAAVIAGVLFVSRDYWLRGLGKLLVRDDGPQKTDLIVVLGGDFHGKRVLKACQLAEAGYAPKVLVSGGMMFYGVNEADLAIRYAVDNGCPLQTLDSWPVPALSTAEEARGLLPELRRRGVKIVTIVTSNYHTARAARICQREFGDDIQVRMAAAPDQYFGPERWWKSREGQKTAFFEYTKTISAAAGL